MKVLVFNDSEFVIEFTIFIRLLNLKYLEIKNFLSNRHLNKVCKASFAIYIKSGFQRIFLKLC